MPSFKEIKNDAEMEQVLSRYRSIVSVVPEDDSFLGFSKAQFIQDFFVDLRRIADRLDPPSPNKVGTPYVADRLGCTTVWITELIRKGEIKSNCIVPGTGNGKPWKFFKPQIDRWIKER